MKSFVPCLALSLVVYNAEAGFDLRQSASADRAQIESANWQCSLCPEPTSSVQASSQFAASRDIAPVAEPGAANPQFKAGELSLVSDSGNKLATGISRAETIDAYRVERKRDAQRVSGSYRLSGNWQLAASYQRLEHTGQRLQTAALLNDVQQLSIPVDTQTDTWEFNLTQRFSLGHQPAAAHHGYTKFSYQLSQFEQHNPSFQWLTPDKDSIGFTANQLALAPSNRAHKLVFSSGLLGSKSRINSQLGVSLWQQDELLLPYTSNTQLSQLPLAAESLDGEVLTLGGSVDWRYRLSKPWQLGAWYQFAERRDNTAELAWQPVLTDSEQSDPASPITATRYGYQHQRAGGELDWMPTDWSSLSAGFRIAEQARNNQAREQTDERTWWLKARNTLRPALSSRLLLSHSRFAGSPWRDPEHTPLYLASRRQEMGQFSLLQQAIGGQPLAHNQLAMNFQFTDYDAIAFKQQHNRQYGYSVGLQRPWPRAGRGADPQGGYIAVGMQQQWHSAVHHYLISQPDAWQANSDGRIDSVNLSIQSAKLGLRQWTWGWESRLLRSQLQEQPSSNDLLKSGDWPRDKSLHLQTLVHTSWQLFEHWRVHAEVGYRTYRQDNWRWALANEDSVPSVALNHWPQQQNESVAGAMLLQATW